MNPYIGHNMQICGVQEYRLTGGKADGMRMLRVRNGKGLDFEISLDRCADIAQLGVCGTNYSYISPCGYVHPAYYQSKGGDFLKSFTAGFFTTCGLTAVGTPCVDDGEELGLHGNISHTPSESFSVDETEEYIIINAKVRDASIFSHQLMLYRTYKISKTKNEIELSDKIVNIGPAKSPLLLLYHCNIGYPILTEKSEVVIPANSVCGRNEFSAKDIDNCLKMEKPQKGYEERCFYHDVVAKNNVAKCGIYSPDAGKGLVMEYCKDTLDYFTEWKMLGENEYVLGLEPGNCTPDGRNVLREKGTLKFINPGEEYTTKILFCFAETEKEFKERITC